MDAQVTYGFGFGRSLHGWKAKKITFQMALVPGPNSSGVDGKIHHKLVSRTCLSVAPLFLVLWAMYLVLAH
jgi:hypothetical protein